MPTNHGELNDAQVMKLQFVKARGHSASFLEQANAAFNDVASSILLGIETRWPATTMPDLVQPFGNDSTDVMSSQPLPDTAMAICPVLGHLLRSPPAARTMQAHRLLHRFGIQRFTRLPGTDLGHQRQTGTIGEQVQFGAPASATTAERMIAGFVGQEIFFPHRQRPCVHVRWSHRCTITSIQSGRRHRVHVARQTKCDPTGGSPLRIAQQFKGRERKLASFPPCRSGFPWRFSARPDPGRHTDGGASRRGCA